jgi:hypothetical protein
MLINAPLFSVSQSLVILLGDYDRFIRRSEPSTSVGSEVLTAVIMKSTVFWDIMLCSPLKVNRRFGGKYRLKFQARRIGRGRNARESKWQAALLAIC